MRPLALWVVVAAGCSPSSPSGPPPKPPPPAFDPTTSGIIQGLVAFRGVPPANPRLPVGGHAECAALHSEPALDEIVLVKDGKLQNVFVRVKEGLESYTFPWPDTPVTLANRRCVYAPRVIGVQVHQPVRFANEDPTDHNVRGDSFNFTLYGRGTERSKTFPTPQVMAQIRCDLHPWMVGWIGVVPHPYFAVTGPDGSFAFKGLPPGEYLLEAWHEKYGPQTLRVKLLPGGSAQADFAFPP